MKRAAVAIPGILFLLAGIYFTFDDISFYVEIGEMNFLVAAILFVFMLFILGVCIAGLWSWMIGD